MKTKLLTGLLLFLILLNAKAQEPKVKPLNGTKFLTTGIKRALPEIKCSGLINEPSVDLKWKPILKTLSPENDMELDEKIEALKAKNDILKKQAEMQNSRNANEETSGRSITPVIGVNYDGNQPNGGCPPDNSIAISNGGYIVATANSTIEYDDMSGNNLYYKSLEGASGFFADATLDDICDANVIYDAGADRFIMVTQTCGLNHADSKLIISFSKTNNPMNGWWVYKFSGNLLNDASWFDFPRIAVSTNELYVTGNLFYNAGGFNQAVLLQMTKSVGYSGGTYNSTNENVWYNINDGNGNPSFTLVPASGGQSNYGPGVYLVGNEGAGGSTLTLYDLTDDITGSPALNAYAVTTPTYYVGSNTFQLGTTDRLDLRDIRMLGAFYQNGIVHCVFHSKDPNNPYNDINYNRINVSNHTNQNALLGLGASNYDYAYPSLASFATSPTDKSVMIAFMRGGSAIYPEERVINCDDNMNWSGSTLAKAGDGPVTDCATQGVNRWGDYSMIARKHNSATPSVWMSAHHGTSSNGFGTWIAEVHQSSTVQAPVALFGASNTSICSNGCINFSDNSTNNPTSWSWSFPGGNPSSSTAQNPNNICYSNPGTYNVSLTATNSGGSNNKTSSNYITVNTCGSTPVASFSASNSTVCANDCINFTDNSSNNPTSWSWSFSGGNPSASSARNPTNICYANPGNYNVSLTATNSVGNNTKSNNNYITVNSCTGVKEVMNNSSVAIYPNPVADIFKIEFTLTNSEELAITITDDQGRLIKDLFRGQAVKGENMFSFNKSNLSAGIYFLNIQTTNQIIKNAKIIIAK